MGINMLEEAWKWAWGTEDGGPTGGANPQLTAIEGQIISLKGAINNMTIEMDGEKVAKIIDKRTRRSGR